MKTINGCLILTKKEIEGLDVVARHSAIDQNFGGEGTFNIGEHNNYDVKEGEKAILGRKVIEFIMHITK